MDKYEAQAFQIGRNAFEDGKELIPIRNEAIRPLIRDILTDENPGECEERLFCWYLGYLTRECNTGEGLEERRFRHALKGMFGAGEDATEKWQQNIRRWAEENPEHSQSHWRVSILAGLTEIREKFGVEIAKTLVEYDCRKICLKPRKMQSAAKMLSDGCTIKELNAAIEAGKLENQGKDFPWLSEEKYGDYIDGEFFAKVDRICNRCRTQVNLTGVPEEYAYQCKECDEDLYEIETQPRMGGMLM